MPSKLSRAAQPNLFDPEELARSNDPWERAAEADRLAAQVVFNRPLDTVYDYLIPDELRERIGEGQRVRVPFGQGNRMTVGYCVSVGPATIGNRRLKSIESIVDPQPLISREMLDLTRWIAHRYLCAWGQVLDSVVPAGVKKQSGTRLVNHFLPTPETCDRLAELRLPPKQRALLELLCSAREPLTIEQLTEEVGCGSGPVDALRKKGYIRTVRRRSQRPAAEVESESREDDLKLNDDQQAALNTIQEVMRSAEHRTIVLHGVTGSGKTEVYMQAIREVVSYGRQAIVLVPEISLTPQTIHRFRKRFESVAVLHSHLSHAERHRHWQQIARGGVQVVVGARSAVFAPTPHLGMIVIDEEHETSFKQETTPRYDARAVARQRAKMRSVPLVLGSATPTLETWLRVGRKQDLLVRLPRRVEKLPLPPVVIIDIRNDPHCTHGAVLGRALESAMRTALDGDGQIILFLNLRGFSPAIWCRGCGESVKCPSCDMTLTWHQDRGVALCHFCDHHQNPPSHCPHCGRGGMRYVGAGTQRLEQEVKAKFPGVACLRMDSDAMRKPGSHDKALSAFRRGDVKILVGTQMIAKGLDFPNVTLVGVVDADTILHQPDFRAAERTFQLIAQVAGRTGRSRRGGRVFVQSRCPTEPAILHAAAHDYETFAAEELVHRREMLAPPYRHFTRVILRGRDEEAVRDQARHMARLLADAVEADKHPVRILGPAPAPTSKLKNHYRYHLQLSSETFAQTEQLWRSVADRMPKGQHVEFVVDVDPINMR